MANSNSQIRERKRIELREPKHYVVIFHNDDFTPMDFVVGLLRDVFHKPIPEAEAIMLKVHKEGQAVVGTYTYDMARTRAEIAISIARKAGYPLRISYKEE